MIKKVDHIGVAVKSIDEAARFYTQGLGLSLQHVEDIPYLKLRVGFLPVGDSEIELVEGTQPDSPVDDIIKERGEGLYHICLEVDDIEAALASLKSQGYPLRHTSPQPGSAGRKIAFLAPEAANGVLIGLAEKPKA